MEKLAQADADLRSLSALIAWLSRGGLTGSWGNVSPRERGPIGAFQPTGGYLRVGFTLPALIASRDRLQFSRAGPGTRHPKCASFWTTMLSRQYAHSGRTNAAHTASCPCRSSNRIRTALACVKFVSCPWS